MARDEFMDLVGADYVDEYKKTQLSQEGTEERTETRACDCINRQRN